MSRGKRTGSNIPNQSQLAFLKAKGYEFIGFETIGPNEVVAEATKDGKPARHLGRNPAEAVYQLVRMIVRP